MPPTLTLRQLNRATLARQGLLTPLPPAPVADARRARSAALQAQHPDWPPLALQTRVGADGRDRLTSTAPVTRKSVVRASLMRMTIHVVSADDFWPLSTLTLPLRAWPVARPCSSWIRSPRRSESESAQRTPPPSRPSETSRSRSVRSRRSWPATCAAWEIPPNRALWRHFLSAVPLVQVPHPQGGIRARPIRRRGGLARTSHGGPVRPGTSGGAHLAHPLSAPRSARRAPKTWRPTSGVGGT